MGSLSPIHWMLVIGVAVLLFGGRGKISGIMGDFAKGIKAFKAGMKEPDEETSGVVPPAQVQSPAAASAAAGVVERPRERV